MKSLLNIYASYLIDIRLLDILDIYPLRLSLHSSSYSRGNIPWNALFPMNITVNIFYPIHFVNLFKNLLCTYSGMNVRIVYESSTTSNVVGLSVRHNNTRIHVRVRQEVGYR